MSEVVRLDTLESTSLKCSNNLLGGSSLQWRTFRIRKELIFHEKKKELEVKLIAPGIVSGDRALTVVFEVSIPSCWVAERSLPPHPPETQFVAVR